MVDHAVLADWWGQLGMDEQVRLLYYSDSEMPDDDKAILKCAAPRVAGGSYSSYRRSIQELIERAFLSGRDGDEFWFAVTWTFDCPSCKRQSVEHGSIRYRSKEELEAFLATQGATCMNCQQAPPQGINVCIQGFPAPLAVLRELGIAPSAPGHSSRGTRYLEAWKAAKGF
jgi:hypothetical protein